MSSNLGNTAGLGADAGFQRRVLAAIVEHGKSALMDTSTDFAIQTLNRSLAKAILWDPPSYQALFAALVADDDTISTHATATDVTDDEIRGVVSAVWGNVGAIIAKIG